MTQERIVNWMKKAASLLLCVVLCAQTCLPVYADSENGEEQIPLYGKMEPSQVKITGENQIVVFHLYADSTIKLAGIEIQLVIPEPFTFLQASTGSEIMNMYENSQTVYWMDEDQPQTLTEIAAISYLVPAGTPEGTYSIGAAKVAILEDNQGWQKFEVPITQTFSLNYEGYTAGLSALSNETSAGETVNINVAVGNADETSFSAAELILNYDSDAFTFNEEKSYLGTASVGDTDGTLKIEDYGQDKNFGSSAYILAFDALCAGTGKISLVSASFGSGETAEDRDLTLATIIADSIELNIAKRTFAVTLDEIFDGPSSATEGEDYTFTKASDGTNYDYGEITALVNGTETNPVIGENGTYIIPNVSGPVTITGSRTPKHYAVTFAGNAAEEIEGAAQAVYGTDYSFTVPTVKNWAYSVESLTIGGKTYTGYTAEEGTYTISGSAICGDISVTVTKQQAQGTVTVEGSGAGAAAGYTPTVTLGQDYSLTLHTEQGYTYEVTAEVSGKSVPVVDSGDGVYTVKEVEGNLTFTVQRTVNTNGVTVSKYLDLDGTAVWLVRNSVTLDDGHIPSYAGAAMYWSEQYNAYCALTIEQTLSLTQAAAQVDITDGTPVSVDYGMDVNKSGKVDANDAQLIYNIYNARYSGFTEQVPAEKYLRADTNGDGEVNVADAAAVIDWLLKQQ